jgi:hypothetical protein
VGVIVHLRLPIPGDDHQAHRFEGFKPILSFFRLF